MGEPMTVPTKKGKGVVPLVPLSETKEAVVGAIQRAYEKTGKELATTGGYKERIAAAKKGITDTFNAKFEEEYVTNVEFYSGEDEAEQLGESKRDMVKELTAEIGEARTKKMFKNMSDVELVRAVSWWEARGVALDAATESSDVPEELANIQITATWTEKAMVEKTLKLPKVKVIGMEDSLKDYLTKSGVEVSKKVGDALYAANKNAHVIKEKQNLNMNINTAISDFGLNAEVTLVALPVLIKHLNAEAKKKKLPLLFGMNKKDGSVMAIWDYTGEGKGELARIAPTEFQKIRTG